MSKLTSLTYNAFQFAAIQFQKKSNFWEIGRGGGKSTAFGRVIADQVMAMPRSIGICVGSSYTQILTRTLPSTIHGLEMHGIYKDLHYFVGRKAPEKWGFPEPYMPPLNYKYALHFWNGAVLLLVSQDRPGTGRGLNSDWVLADEAGLLDKTALDNDVRLTCRGSNREAFLGIPQFEREFYATSTPVTARGDWWFEMEQTAIEQPDNSLFLRCPSHVNLQNLGKDYFKRLKATLYPHTYRAEILCERIKKVKDCFYPLYDEKLHTYVNYNYNYYDKLIQGSKPTCLGDADILRDKPLILGVDWGAAINCLCVAQLEPAQLTFLKSMFVLDKNKKIIDDLAKDFCTYYAPHRNKMVYLCYDNTGNNRQANSYLTYAQQFSNILKASGWKVITRTKGGTNPRHSLKYQIWNSILREEETEREVPRVRFNRENCRELLVSMGNAKSKTDKGYIQKDKSSERKLELRQHATDLSDAADSIINNLGESWVKGQRVQEPIFLA